MGFAGQDCLAHAQNGVAVIEVMDTFRFPTLPQFCRFAWIQLRIKGVLTDILRQAIEEAGPVVTRIATHITADFAYILR